VDGGGEERSDLSTVDRAASPPPETRRPWLAGWRRLGLAVRGRAALAVRSRAAWGGLAVLAVAVPLRVATIGFGLPALTHPDEGPNVRVGDTMSYDADWNPHRFNYPSMLYDTIAVFARLNGWMTGRNGPASDHTQMQNLGTGMTSEPNLFLALRAFSSLLSLAICLLVYLVVLRVTGRVLAALLAGLLLAVSPIMVSNAVFISPDTYSGLFSAVALAGALGVLRRGRLPYYLVAGAGTGLAAAAKYNAVVVAVAVIAAHLIRHGRSSWRRPAILLSGAAAIVLFTLVTPAVLLDYRNLREGALFEVHHYARGHPGSEGGALWYVTHALRPDLLLLAGAVLSIACLRSRHRREVAVVLPFVVAYAGLLSVQVVHFARNLLPVLPGLAMLAGFAAAVGAERVSRLPVPARRTLAAVAAAAVAAGLAVPTVAAAGLPRRLAERPRTEALGWLTTHIPAGAHVVVEPYGPYIVRGRWRLTEQLYVVSRPEMSPDTAAIVVTELGSGRFLSQPQRYRREVANYDALRTRYCVAGRWTDGPWVEVLTPCTPEPPR
jgi:hypothetical protein